LIDAILKVPFGAFLAIVAILYYVDARERRGLDTTAGLSDDVESTDESA